MTITCPYCNAPIDPTTLHRTGETAPCTRCGDPLPAHLVRDVPIGSAPTETTTQGQPWTNRKVGVAIVVVMFVMAGIGLVFALLTESSRRKNDYRNKKEAPSLTVQTPGELAGLGYLPADCNVVAALQVAEMLNDPAAKKLLEAPRPWLLDLAMSAIEKWAKVKAEDIDHVVVGTTLGTQLPQVTAIIRTRKPYGDSALAEMLAPAKATTHKGKPLYRFALQPGEGMLWHPEPQTLVLLLRIDALKLHDLDAVAVPPRSGKAKAPAAIEPLLERVGKQSLAWVAGDWQDAAAVKDMLALAPLGREEVQLLAKIDALTLSVQSSEGLVLVGNFHGTDAAAAEAIKKRLEDLPLPSAAKRSIVPAPADAKGPGAGWVIMQVRGDAAALGSQDRK